MTPPDIYLSNKSHHGQLSFQENAKKWRFQVSIPVPLACEASALPFELNPRVHLICWLVCCFQLEGADAHLPDAQLQVLLYCKQCFDFEIDRWWPSAGESHSLCENAEPLLTPVTQKGSPRLIIGHRSTKQTMRTRTPQVFAYAVFINICLVWILTRFALMLTDPLWTMAIFPRVLAGMLLT